MALTIPSVLLPVQNLGIFNRMSYSLVENMIWKMYKPAVNKWREQNGLEAYTGKAPMTRLFMEKVPALYGFSSHLFPKPHDWGAHYHLVGYWFLESNDDWTPSKELQEFMEAGSPPLSVGFGSMNVHKSKETAKLVFQAAEASGQRVVYLGGWGSMEGLAPPSKVFCAESIPHSWLFPKVAGVIHHGGAGTTAAGILAGKPSFIVPFGGDQYFWGACVWKQGAGIKPVPRKKISVDDMADAMNLLVKDTELGNKAKDLGGKLLEEDGLAGAYAFLQQYAL